MLRHIKGAPFAWVGGWEIGEGGLFVKTTILAFELAASTCISLTGPSGGISQ